MNRHNTCLVVGNIGADPAERGRGGKGGPVVAFTVAENVRAYDEDTGDFKTTHTNWFPVTTFGNVAERARKHLRKGDRVVVQGRMKISKYTDRSGEERSGFEIIADEVALWKSLPASEPAPARASSASAPSSPSAPNAKKGKKLESESDDLPF
jgi:single-strand DNA-binding protein